MVLNVGGWREGCCGVVRGGGGGGKSVVVLYVEGGEGGLLWYCVWRGREVCSGVVRGEMEGGLLWYCVWRDGGRFVVVLYVGGWREVCCGVERRGLEGVTMTL